MCLPARRGPSPLHTDVQREPSLICPSHCQGAVSGKVGRARVATPGPGLIESVRGQTCAYPLRGVGPRQADAQAGFTLISLATALGAAHSSMLRARQGRLSFASSLTAHFRDARDGRELPVPARVRSPGGWDVLSVCGGAGGYAAAPSPSSSPWTCSPMTQIQRTSSFTTATLALFAFACRSRARWS